LSHAYSTATSRGPQITTPPVAHALMSKTPVSALLANAIEKLLSYPMFLDVVSQTGDGGSVSGLNDVAISVPVVAPPFMA
jgi:hypothetical protein